MGRFTKPESVRLSLSEGDWLLVKKRLNAGEQRRVYTRMIGELAPSGKVSLDPMQVGRALVQEYLLDWSFTDDQGHAVVIRDKSSGELADVLDSLEIETFEEVSAAVNAHDSAMREARELEKNVRAGEPASSAILSSVG